MSRKINRSQISPVKIKPITEQRRSNFNSDVQRIINHAAKLISTYDKNALENLYDEDLDNQSKIDKLVRNSKSNLPKITMENRPKTSRKRKRRKDSSVKKHKKKNEENESDKIDYNFSFEFFNDSSKNFDKQKKPSQNSKSISPIKIDQKMEDSSKHDSQKYEKINSKSENQTTLSDISFEKSLSCSICSEKSHSMKHHDNQLENEKAGQFIYEIEIKTADKDFLGEDDNVFIQLYGESDSMTQSIILNRINSNKSQNRLFGPGSIDKFSISHNENLGSIVNVKIGIETQNKKTLWGLEYLCVRDCTMKFDYFFSCRRCLGIDSPDKLTQITLGYTQPFKNNKYVLLSKSNTDNPDCEILEEPIKSEKEDSRSSSSNSSRSYPSLSQHSEQSQNTKIYESLNGETESSKISINKDSIRKSRNRKLSNNSKDKSITLRSQSTPEVIYSKIKKEMKGDSQDDIDIHSAVKTHNVLRVKQLCKIDDNNKNDVDENGCKPIHLAGFYFEDKEECKEIFQYLISLSVDVNTKSKDNLTSLHYAVISDNLLGVKYLIEHCHANPNVTDGNGETPLQIANKNHSQNIADYLAAINRVSFEDSSEIFIERKTSSAFSDESSSSSSSSSSHNEELKPLPRAADKSGLLLINNNLSRSSPIKEVATTIDLPVKSNLPLIENDASRSTPIKGATATIDSPITPNSPLIENDSSRSTPMKEVTTTKDSPVKPDSPFTENDSSRSIESKEIPPALDFISNIQPIKIDNPNLTPIPTSVYNNTPEKSDNLQSIEFQKKKKIISDEDNIDNSESRQFEAENSGLMLHKTLPEKQDYKIKFKDEDFSSISGNSEVSPITSGKSDISIITPRPNSTDTLSDIIETNRNNEIEHSNDNHLVEKNLQMKGENDQNNKENTEQNIIPEEIKINNRSQLDPLSIDKQQDHSILNGQFQPIPDSS